MENGESKLRKVLFNEVSLALSIAAAVFWLMSYVNSPINRIQLDIALIQKDISNINSNHEQHIQDIQTSIEKILVENSRQNEQIIELQKQVLVLINKK